MLFFKVEAKHNMTLNEDKAVRHNQLSDIAAAFKKYNCEHDEAYYFISELAEENVIAGFVLYVDEARKDLIKFPWDVARMEVHSETIYEVTSYMFGELLDNAVYNEFIENMRFNRLLRDKLSLFSRNYSEGILSDEDFYSENISDESSDIDARKKRAKDFLWCDSLIKEHDSIASMKRHDRFMGHPVHYLFASDNYDERELQAKNLVATLYANGRLNSRRYCSISVSNVGGRDLHYLDELYECYNGGTIMLRYRHAARADVNRDDVSMETVYKITSLIKQYANKVLTVLCFPLSCTKEKDVFYGELSEMSFLEFHDDAVGFERAKEYLTRKSEAAGVTVNDKLFSAMDSEKTYRAEELDTMFNDWYGAYLRLELYPEYAKCEKVGCQQLQEEVRGNSYQKLMDMIGLSDAKSVISKAVDYYKAQKVFGELGFEQDTLSMHMVFTGNPGTAKTTVARLFASIMRENEILPSGHLVEVGRGDIVGKYVGQTAPLVKAAFRRAKGGVLFIDEAYSLVDDKDGLYGDEAINTIVQEMENHREDTCVIFAGYPDKMEKFLDKNPGLRSRIAFHVPFADYSADELIQITQYMGGNKGIVFADDAIAKLGTIYESAKDSTDFGNGRFVRNMLEKARMAQATRLIGLGYDNVTGDVVKTITAADIEDYIFEKKQKPRIGFAV